MMSSSRRKQMKPRSMKVTSPEPNSVVIKVDYYEGDHENDEDFGIDGDEAEHEDFDKTVKSTETPTSAASFNEAEDAQMSDGEPEDGGLLDLVGEDADTADPLGQYNNNGAPSSNKITGNNNGGSASKSANGGTDSSPFECHICHRKFKHRRSKSRHVMYHTGQKRHFCRYCNASFYRSDHLKAHTRTHTMPGILDANGEGQNHRQQPASQVSALRNNLPKKHVTISNGNNKRPSFDFNASALREDIAPEPPLKIAHKDDTSLLANYDLGRRSVSSAEHTNSNFAIEPSYDARHSMSTPLFYSDAHNSNNNNNNDEPSALAATLANRSISNESETGHRRCPFCQSSFSTADQLRRHLREENCTLHPDINNTSSHNSHHNHHQQNDSLPQHQQSSRTKLDQFAIPEPISRSGGNATFSCPLCPTSQHQQQFSQATMLVHLACEHRFTQDHLLTAIQQTNNGRNTETPGSTNSGQTNNSKSQVDSLLSQGLPSFVCPSCDLSTANLAKFHQHMFSAHLKFYYRCSLCNFSAPESEALAKHFLSSHCRVVVNPTSPNATATTTSSSGVIDYSNQSGKPLQLSRQNVVSSPLPSPAHSNSNNNGTNNKTASPSSLVCPICSLSCASRDSFLVHMVTSHSWVRCSNCADVFSNERTLDKHVESEHRTISRGSNGLPLVPGSNFLQTLLQNSNNSNKAHHPTPYHSDSVIQCLACSRTFRGRLAMKQHLIQFHHFDHVTKSFVFAEEVFYVCEICPDVFRTANVLAEHNLIAHPQISVPTATTSSASSSSSTSSVRRPTTTGFPCSFCRDAFAVAIDLEKHMVEKHSEDLLKSTSNVISAVAQQQTVPPKTNNVPRKLPNGSKPVVATNNSNATGKQSTTIRCQQCSAVFESQYALEMHAFEEHLMNAVRANGATSAPIPDTGEPVEPRPHSATLVNDAMTVDVDETSLPSATNTTAPKRFQCSVCDKIFADLPLLAQHRMREHGAGCCGEANSSSATSMRCPLCRVNLTSANDYLKHADSHHKGSTNLNRTYYACCLCNEYLRDMADLTNHAVRVHFPDALSCIICDSPLPDITASRSIRLPGTNDLVYCCPECYDVDAESRRCNLCNAVFDTVDNLKWHNAKYHAINNGKVNGGVLNKTNNAKPIANNNNNKAVKPPAVTPKNVLPESSGNKNGGNNSTFVLPMPVNLQCSLCDTLCLTEDSLTLHLIEHSFPDGNYQCPICADQDKDQDDQQVYFDSAFSLDEHVRSTHGANAIGSSTCLCTECNRTFLWPAELNHHVAQHDLERDEHASQPVPGSAQTKATAAALQNKVANLAPLQSFSCNVCQRSFPTVRSLANHQRQCLSKNRMTASNNTETATNGDDAGDQGDDNSTILAEPSEFLRCFICKNKFANAQSLQKHARTIHGLESAEFWCPLCDSKLVNYKQLLHHLSTEHDINIAQSVCELCGDAFTMLKNLKRHLKRVHKVIWQAPVSSLAASATTCASQHMAVMNGVALTGADSSSVGTSEESPEDTAITVVDD